MAKMLVIITLIGLIAGSRGQSPVFKDGAADRVNWRFKDRPKLDVSKVCCHLLIGDHEDLKMVQALIDTSTI